MLLSSTILIIFSLGAVAQPPISLPAVSIKVTVAFFSGRNDPEWKVSPSTQLTQLFTKTKGFFPESMPVRLGYKGMLVVDLNTNEERLFVGPETSDLQLQLLQTIPRDLLKSGDLEEIANDIRAGKVTAVEAPVFKVRGKRYAPPYTPLAWNAIEPVFKRRECNNCYNYVNRRATNTRAQPGWGGGQQYTQYTIVNLVAAAQRDGLTLLNPQPAAIAQVPGPPNHISQHLVALVIRPDTINRGGDHHWYRLDSNGRWSHKPGQNFVTQDDNAGAPIVDPRAANLGGYVFARFMVSDPLTVNIGSAWVCPV